MTTRCRYVIVLIAALACTLQSGAAELQPPATNANWQREDLKVFREKFLNVDRSFSRATRAAAEARIVRLENATEPLDPSTFAVELCRIAALADNGHTQCLPGRVGPIVCARYAALVTDDSPWCHLQKPDFEIPDFRNVPITFYPFGEDFYVIAVDSEHADLLGAQLVAVDGKPVATIRETLRTFAGGTTSHRDEVAADVLSSPEKLRAVKVTRQGNSVNYEFVLSGKGRTEQKFSVPSPSTPPPKWQQLPSPERTSWSLREPDKPFRFRDAPEIDSVVIQLRQIMDTDDEKIADFLEKSERQRQTLGRRNVVLDMRANGGGNLLLARDFMIHWPTRVPGKFYVLTSRQTFSAAITSIAYLKQAGTTRVLIIGEPIGDRLMFFSDGLPVQLPHSGLFFLPAVVRMDYADGCRRYDDCFEGVAQPGHPTAVSLLKLPPDLRRIPISVRSLAPDVFVPQTITALSTGDDPAMDAVRKIAGASAFTPASE